MSRASQRGGTSPPRARLHAASTSTDRRASYRGDVCIFPRTKRTRTPIRARPPPRVRPPRVYETTHWTSVEHRRARAPRIHKNRTGHSVGVDRCVVASVDVPTPRRATKKRASARASECDRGRDDGDRRARYLFARRASARGRERVARTCARERGETRAGRPRGRARGTSARGREEGARGTIWWRRDGR